MPVQEAAEEFDLIFGDDNGSGSLILKSSPVAGSRKRSASLANHDDGVREEIITSNKGKQAFESRIEDEVDYEISSDSPTKVDAGTFSSPVHNISLTSFVTLALYRSHLPKPVSSWKYN